MKKALYFIASILIFGTVSAQNAFVSATDLGITSSTFIRALAGKGTYDVQAYKITYNTTDVDGSTTVASGLLCVPINPNCVDYPLMAYNHGTVLERENVPSRDNSEAFITKAFATQGMISVSPDYLGLGDNPGLHPYLHAETQATATLDLIDAAREYSRDSLGLSFNGECVFSGYSQGGHASMATVKYIQDNNLTRVYNIKAAGPASGPYNLSGSQSEVLISNQPYSNPGYVCYLLFGLNRVYGNLYNNVSEILKAPYDTLIPPYFDGTFPMDSVNAKLPSRLADFMQDTVLTNFINDSVNKTHPLWQALLAQDNFDWRPNFPLKMYYCTLDEQVEFQNSLDAEAAMTANGATQVMAINKGARNHGGCVTPSLFDARDYFDTVLTACKNIGLDEKQKFSKFKAYPNPASKTVYLDGFENSTEVTVRIYSLSGALLNEQKMTAEKSFDVSSLSAGTYLASVRSKAKTDVFKFTKR